MQNLSEKYHIFLPVTKILLSITETAKFYKALAMVGIDFFLIQKILPNRQRFELTVGKLCRGIQFLRLPPIGLGEINGLSAEEERCVFDDI